jgi:hypothetical protein
MSALWDDERGRVIPFPVGRLRTGRANRVAVDGVAVTGIGRVSPMDWAGASYHAAAIEAANAERRPGQVPGRS